MTNVRISTDKLVELIAAGHNTNESISRAVGIAFNRKKGAINDGSRSDGVSSSLRRAKKAGRIKYSTSLKAWVVCTQSEEAQPKPAEEAGAAAQ
jgi:hypothetical protein